MSPPDFSKIEGNFRPLTDQTFYIVWGCDPRVGMIRKTLIGLLNVPFFQPEVQLLLDTLRATLNVLSPVLQGNRQGERIPKNDVVCSLTEL